MRPRKQFRSGAKIFFRIARSKRRALPNLLPIRRRQRGRERNRDRERNRGALRARHAAFNSRYLETPKPKSSQCETQLVPPAMIALALCSVNLPGKIAINFLRRPHESYNSPSLAFSLSPYRNNASEFAISSSKNWNCK